ncbi:DUF6503 family protein [Maribacter sp. 2210JD10-5]|uniref:DUF6503 family protein n=1 Tax=Maribacter sp. 2210JD10-5 TaxID=3386272 RepID=UPI0039BC8332
MQTHSFSLSIRIVLVFFMAWSGLAQELSGEELLEKAISYHDPEGNWRNFKGTLAIEMTTPDKGKRSTTLFLNLPGNYYKSIVLKDDHTIESVLDRGNCTLKLDNSEVISDEYREQLNITCERAKMMKDYYTYLYGLPMKLKDPGTYIDPKVEKVRFKDKEYLRLKATYDPEVGKDIWYFYFDAKTYAMEVYQFYHDETKNDGEYILLTDILEINDIKMPKVRAWYYNKEDKYLGTDVLTKAVPL